MRKLINLILLSLVFYLVGCEKDIFDNPKYQRPEWLVGKLYSQAKSDEELSKFVEILDKTIYADILDRSDYFTLFAPTNEAIDEFLANNNNNNNNLGISSIENLSERQAENLIRYLVIQDGWTSVQLRDMGPSGFGEPTAYKRETLYPPYPYSEIGADYKQRSIVQNNYKHVPLFYKEYFDFHKKDGSDYEYFFPWQKWDESAIYYAGGKIIGKEIPAENGFLYKVDRMVAPLESLDAITRNNEKYSLFHTLTERFANFEYDDDETSNQLGVEDGSKVDSLWQKKHSLVINIDEEKINKGLGGRRAWVNNYTVFAPSNEALNQYIQEEILKHYSTLSQVPDFILELIVNAHLRDEVTYPSDIREGVSNGERDKIFIDPVEDVDEKTFATNGTFYGLNKVIKPRALNSVIAPLLLDRDYEWFAQAINMARIVDLLKKENREYTIFAPNNEVMEMDSMFVWYSPFFVEYLSPMHISLVSSSEVSDMVFQQIAYGTPEGFAKEEFLQTISGHYIKILNGEQEVRSLGNPDSVITINQIPLQIEDGEVYNVSARFQPYARRIYNTIYNGIEFRKFRDLLIEAGLINQQRSKFSFVGDNHILTIKSVKQTLSSCSRSICEVFKTGLP